MLADLTPKERELLEWLLPRNRPFYAKVITALEKLDLSRLSDGSIEFGRYDDDLAETVAVGEIDHPSASISIRFDDADQGAMLSIPSLRDDTRPIWTLSSWTPGDPGPREIEFKDAVGTRHFVFALSPSRRVLWLHHVENGYNQLLPVTGLLVELVRLKRMASTAGLTHDVFFELADRSSDDVLMEALLEYNKRSRKFDASKVSLTTGNARRGSGFNFFRKRH